MNKLNNYTLLAGRILIATMFVISGLSILTALIFHGNLADQMQYFLFMKNSALAGGFLFLLAIGSGTIALDARTRA